MNLDGQRIVIVGGTSGMGRATARSAAELSADVVAAGRRPVGEREPLDGVREMVVDVSDERSVQALFEQVGALEQTLVNTLDAQR